MGGADQALREAVQTAIEVYTKDNFSESVTSATYATKGGSSIVVCISGAEFDARNMWSGRWRSTWECTVEADQLSLKGTFKVDVHFYEDGNVQAKSTHEVSETVCTGDSPDATAEALVDAVKSAETKYQSLLDGAYVNLLKDHSIMNGLRRPLPIDKQKVNFKTLVSQGRLAGSLK
jgi:capping protein alpha